MPHSRSFGGLRRSIPLLLALLSMPSTLPCRAGVEVIDAQAKPFVELDAAGLPDGPVSSWSSSGGSLRVNLSPEGKPPAAAERNGNRALWFDAAEPLRSAEAVSAELISGKSFSLTAVVYLPESTKRQVIASWASRPNGTAEFSCGNGDDGAFFGWDRRARFLRPPSPAAWHHLTWTYDQAELRIYVDGDLDARSPGKLNIKPDGRLIVGAGWDAAGKKPIYPFKGGLAKMRIWTRALTQREVRADAGLTRAFAAEPADGSNPPAEGLMLRWQAGSDRAVAYDVRQAATRDGLSDAAPHRVTAFEFQPGSLAPGTRVYWRVDQLDSAGMVIEPGDVWTFTTDDGPATAPAPRDHVANVPHGPASLRWKPGRYAVGQKLFWGTSADAVLKGTSPPVALDAKADTFALPPTGLDFGTTYYWRVEELNGPLPSAPGEVWAFRTEDKPDPDDVTFFVTSDCHYGFGNNAELNRRVIDQMNWLPGALLPEKAGGGVVRTPRGVVLDGDLLDKGFDAKTAPALWREFVADYGLTGSDGRLAYPLYEGFGNHDGMTGKSISRAAIKERNLKRVGVTAISPEGFHYSWDWDRVHLVQLNLFPGNDSSDCITGPPEHHPEHALQFLKDDLAKHAGEPGEGGMGKVVVIFCHYCYSGGMADWWTPAAKERFREAVKGYRVILIHGHSHGAYFYEWKGLRAISDGAAARPEGQTGDFLVIRINKDTLSVAQRKLDGWGIMIHEPLPASDRSAADAQAAAKPPNPGP